MAVLYLGKRNADQLVVFNLRANVGPNCVNNKDDTELVQFGFFAASRNIDFSPELREMFDKVVPGATYQGGAKEPLTLAIRGYQKFLGGTQDGHVSVIKGAVPMYGGSNVFMLMFLNNNIRDLVGKDYPRLDRHPSCPPALAASVRRSFDW
jgi:hypothetical protein